MKTYKEIENSRNTRLWITEVIIPVGSLAVTTLALIPEARKAIVDKTKEISKKLKRKFTKKEIEYINSQITLRARNDEEALIMLEMMTREIMTKQNNGPINKTVRSKVKN